MLRWRFADPSEESERGAVLARMDAWWRAFAERAEAIDGHFARGVELDLPAFMRDHLHAVEPRLMWEFGPALTKPGHRLVVTPESNRRLRPLVDVLLSRAPALPRWEFYPYRLPEDVEMTYATVSARMKADFRGTRVRLLKGEDSRVGLEYHTPLCRHPEDDSAEGPAFVATETLLGEEILDTWIGEIRTAPLRKAEDVELLPLETLKAAVDARIEGTLAALPDSPRYLLDREASAFTMYKMEAKDREDERHDLYVALSDFPAFFQEAHGRGIFSSRRFSRFGETFCYLKIDTRDVPNDEKIAYRDSFDQALSAALRPAEAGGGIGFGTGLRYSYIFLALMDVAEAVPLLRRVLRGMKAPPKSWLLFFDDELADEWVGIWDETPPPPRA